MKPVVEPQPLSDGTPCYFASDPALPGCQAHGESRDEALRALLDARALYLETLLRLNRPLPAEAIRAEAALSESEVVALGGAGPDDDLAGEPRFMFDAQTADPADALAPA